MNQEPELKLLEQSVRRAEALKNIMENKDFKDLFIVSQEEKLMEIGYNFYHLDDARKEKANKEQEAIGYFFDRIYNLMNEGKQASDQLQECYSEMREESIHG